MGKYQKLLAKFYKETDFLAHSTSYEARTVLEFALWLDEKAAQHSVQADGATCALDHDMLAIEGHSTCPNCGAIPPRR